MKKMQYLLLGLVIVASVATGCRETKDSKIETAVEETKDAVEDAADEAKDAVEDAADEVEDKL